MLPVPRAGLTSKPSHARLVFTPAGGDRQSPPFCGIQGAGFVRSGEGEGVLMIFVRIAVFVLSRGQTWL